MATIQETVADIKGGAIGWLDGPGAEWGGIAVIFLLAFISFGLGRFSALEEAVQPVAIADTASGVQPLLSRPLGGFLIASRDGKAYYFPWCAGAGKIAPANQVWFVSEQAAQSAGYAAGKACKGLTN